MDHLVNIRPIIKLTAKLTTKAIQNELLLIISRLPDLRAELLFSSFFLRNLARWDGALPNCSDLPRRVDFIRERPPRSAATWSGSAQGDVTSTQFALFVAVERNSFDNTLERIHRGLG